MTEKAAKTIDETGADVLDPRKALQEPTLAVDLARIELDQAIATAHRFPRSVDAVIKKIATLACYNKDSAENCVYALPRAGKPIIGPSIGFASIVAQSWGNCRIAAQITYIDRKEKAVVAAGRFFDLESNVETIVPVSRRIVDSKGRLYSDDMIQVTGMAAASIGARNAILRGVSRGLWHPIWLDCLQIVRGDATTFAETKARAVAAMAQFGVAIDKICLALGLKGEIELTLEHIPTIRGMYAQLRDGSITVEEMFDPRRMTGKGFETVENPLGDEEETTGSSKRAPDSAISQPDAAKVEEADPTAGMGEAAPQQASTIPAGQQGGPPVAKNASVVHEVGPGPETAQARPAEAGNGKVVPIKGKPAEPAAASNQPRSPEEYLDHWEEVAAGATSLLTLQTLWSGERDLRGLCRVTGGDFDKAKAIKDARETALRGTA